MKFSKEELSIMDFNDPIEIEEYDEGEEDCCLICGNELKNLKISFSKENQLFKCECSNCNSIYVMPKNSLRDERFILQGEERNWPEYLSEALKFPFNAEIIESNDREFFDPDYDGPCLYDSVKVLEVFYSMKYGVEAKIRRGRRLYRQILCFMEAADPDSRNYYELENYKRWRDKYWLSDFIVALTEAFRENKKDS